MINEQERLHTEMTENYIRLKRDQDIMITKQDILHHDIDEVIKKLTGSSCRS